VLLLPPVESSVPERVSPGDGVCEAGRPVIGWGREAGAGTPVGVIRLCGAGATIGFGTGVAPVGLALGVDRGVGFVAGVTLLELWPGAGNCGIGPTPVTAPAAATPVAVRQAASAILAPSPA
jgi:hypothetical protein